MVRPGACALAARGPARYFGGEEAAAERIVEHVAQSLRGGGQVGVADGVFAAVLAARAGRVVAAGRDAGVPRRARHRGARTGRSWPTCCAGWACARSATSPRCPPATSWPGSGSTRALAHRLAAGRDDRPLAVRQPPPDLDVTGEYDEPLERVDVAAFAARALAERLHERLAGHGLACTRLGIEAVTADGRGAAPGLAPRRAAHRRGHRRPGALAARRLAHRQQRPAPARRAGPTDGRHRPAAAGPRRGGRATPACSPACGARRARSGTGRTGR